MTCIVVALVIIHENYQILCTKSTTTNAIKEQRGSSVIGVSLCVFHFFQKRNAPIDYC